MTTLEELFEQFKKLPDWDKYPLPEVLYEHFNIKKPKPSTDIMSSLCYVPPPSESLNKNGKVEIRPPAEGGVRQIEELPALPVETKLIKDDEEEKKETESTSEQSH